MELQILVADGIGDNPERQMLEGGGKDRFDQGCAEVTDLLLGVLELRLKGVEATTELEARG